MEKLLLIVALASLLVPGIPFVFVPIAFAVYALRIAARSQRAPRRRLLIVLGCAAAVLAVAELILPGKTAVFAACSHEDDERPSAVEGFDGVLGVGPPRSRVVPASEMRGTIQFDGDYTFDEHGLRIRFPSSASEALLFFGCSYQLGLNVCDTETVSWLVGRDLADDYVAYNFAFTGYGPHQMLAWLQSGRVEEIVRQRGGSIFGARWEQASSTHQVEVDSNRRPLQC